MKWIENVINILGDENAENLQEIIYSQYRGSKSAAKRKWNGARTHMEKRMKTSGDKSSNNCTLIETLTFIASHPFMMKSQFVMEGFLKKDFKTGSVQSNVNQPE